MDAGTIPPEDVGEEDVEEREARVEDRVAHDAVPQIVTERLGLGDGRARRRRCGRDRRDRRDGHGHGDFEGVAGLEIRRDDDVHPARGERLDARLSFGTRRRSQLAVDVVLDRVAGRPVNQIKAHAPRLLDWRGAKNQ